MQKFQEKFDTFYNDPEFDFKGDDKLIQMICASLCCENYGPERQETMIPYGVVSNRIILIQEGTVEMFYKYNSNPILIYEGGSYVGEISFLF